jgi:hypothetical protein
MSSFSRNRWRQLASAARRERDPRKFMYLVKQLYDLLNRGEEDSLLGGESQVGAALTQAALAARKGKAA